MSPQLSRRDLLRSGAVLGAGALLGGRAFAAPPPDERLRIGVIGVGGRGGSNLHGVRGENIVALCDIDDARLLQSGQGFPGAALYSDFRRMLEREELDAIVVSTPDHTHAPASLAGLELGKHVYCEKPLTHSIGEARDLAVAAAQAGVATQMGTQIHAGANYRRVVEAVRAGAVGKVHEVHVWCGKGWWASELPTGRHHAPPSIKYDLWLGPAPAVPYNPAYLPANWRRYTAFGGGTLADMACHYMDLPFWALELRHPTSVEADGPEAAAGCAPEWLEVRWEFPAVASDSNAALGKPIQFHWYDGGKRPAILGELAKDDAQAANWGNGVLFVGEKGSLLADYGRHVLLPSSSFADYTAPPKTLPDSIGHHAEWIRACKEGTPTTCTFDYSGALTETVLLGKLAFQAGQGKLSWNAAELTTGNAAADELVRRTPRAGW